MPMPPQRPPRPESKPGPFAPQPRKPALSNPSASVPAPAVYRPQPVPKVLQLKTRPGSNNPIDKNPAQAAPPFRPREAQPQRQQSKPAPHVPPTVRPRAPNAPQTSRNIQRRVNSQVIQRAERTTVNELTDELVLMVMNVTGMMNIGAQGRPDVMNFALTCSRMYDLAIGDERYSNLAYWRNSFLTTHRIPAILQGYANTLEPLRHGAHLDVERLGLPGSGTILGLVVNGRLIPWQEIPEDFEDDDGRFDRSGWEKHVKQKVTTYSQLSIEARPEREQIRAMEISAKDKKALQKVSPGIMKARANSPAATFQVFLLMNRSLKHPSQFQGVLKEWLSKRQATLKALICGSSGIEEYQEFAMVEKEPASCGHSEQLLLMSQEWERVREDLFRIAELKLQGYKGWIQPRQIVLMLNRSPCSSCGRFLVAELEAFWSVLANMCKMPEDQCRLKFKNMFIFRLGYAVKYGKTGVPKKIYPNFTILQALAKAGWLLEKLPKLAPKDRHPESCLDSSTIASMKRKPINLTKIEANQEESDDDYSPGEDDDYDSDGDKIRSPKKRQKRGR